MAGAAEHLAALLSSPSGSSSSNSLFSPRFRTAAALAGWDEEAILASLIVEDTPVREPSTRKKRFRKSKTPTSDSSRKKRAQTRSPPSPIPPVALLLDEAENSNGEIQGLSGNGKDETKEQPTNLEVKKNSSSNSSLPCMDRLREELSCAICLDICYEPTTTPCGHSFCLKCLKCAAIRCGKRCPKCRQLINNGRSCTINTVLWNTIQLLFPQEVESRRKVAAAASTSPASGSKRKRRSLPETSSGGISSSRSSHSTVATNSTHNPTATTASGPWTNTSSRRRNSSAFILSSELVSEAEIARVRRPTESGSGPGSAPTSRPLTGSSSGRSSSHGSLPISRALTGSGNATAPTLRSLGSGRIRGSRRREATVPNQSEDAALALRLQREEFMDFMGDSTNRSQQQPQFLGVQLARANLRALAARAVRISTRTMSP